MHGVLGIPIFMFLDAQSKGVDRRRRVLHHLPYRFRPDRCGRVGDKGLEFIDRLKDLADIRRFHRLLVPSRWQWRQEIGCRVGVRRHFCDEKGFVPLRCLIRHGTYTSLQAWAKEKRSQKSCLETALHSARPAPTAPQMVEREPSDSSWLKLCERIGVLLLWPDRLEEVLGNGGDNAP